MTRVCTFEAEGRVRLGVAAGGAVADLNAAVPMCHRSARAPSWENMTAFLSAGEEGRSAARRVEAFVQAGGTDLRGPDGAHVVFPESEVTFLAPIPRPPKFLCIAGNYMEHLQEGKRGADVDRPSDIHVFTKVGGRSAIGHEAPIVAANTVEMLDYELEIGVVIGKTGRHIPEENAVEHIGGYTCVNDVSDREFMPGPGRSIHWFAMKSQDGFGPMGPYLLLAAGLEHPVDLEMSLWVNGELRQHARTSQMIFPPAQIVSRLSRWVTLEVGDIIATGTPAGNAWSRRRFLEQGDVVELEIEHIGRLRNTVVFEEPAYRNGREGR